MSESASKFWRSKWTWFFKIQLLAAGVGLTLQVVAAWIAKDESPALLVFQGLAIQLIVLVAVTLTYWAVIPLEIVAASLQSVPDIERMRRRQLIVLPIWASWIPVGGGVFQLLSAMGRTPK